MYFDILSGKKSDNFREVFYIFRFLESSKIEELNQKSIELKNREETEEEIKDVEDTSIFVSVKEILNSSPEGRLHLKNNWKEAYNLSDKEVLTVELNMNKLVHSITNDSNILKISTIDENKSRR